MRIHIDLVNFACSNKIYDLWINYSNKQTKMYFNQIFLSQLLRKAHDKEIKLRKRIWV
jgi:hypothetical protein